MAHLTPKERCIQALVQLKGDEHTVRKVEFFSKAELKAKGVL